MMTEATPLSTLIGLALSANVALIIFGVPLYFLLIKPALTKSKFFSGLSSRTATTINTRSAHNDKSKTTDRKNLLIDQSNTVPIEDIAYLAEALSPDSSHMDVLFAVLTTPENIEWSEQDLERAESAYNDRVAKEKKSGKSDKTDKKKDIMGTFDALLEQDGWADDEEDENNNDAVMKSRLAEEERKAEMERLKQATGQAVQLLEGLDDGVLGQKWVEKTLTSAKVWPPADLGFLKEKTFVYRNGGGKALPALEHPGLRRLLCMTIGRLNSLYLNAHPELLEAGAKKLIDQTYFRSSMEFRQRASTVLEAALRVGMIVRCSQLVHTVIETVCMFKIGTKRDAKAIHWFNNHMMKTYNILPRMNVVSKQIVTPGESDVVAGDLAEVHLDIERQHAENFLRQKIESFKAQGIPPQVGLSAYREGWWFLLRMERLDGETPAEPLDPQTAPALKQIQLDDKTIAKFENSVPPSQRLITAWPMMVQNVAQKSGVVKIQFKIPKIPGTYRYTVSIKSQEFLDADQDVSMDVSVLSSEAAKRQPRVTPTPKKDDENNLTTTKEAKKEN